ncbi:MULTISPECIES: Imm26 family immunity protein [unclassified Mesorhizobium]|uniref:Imm26 family immunity protein n=1 Tax=unclassified Mesorhizobium TaxID=325217 RepID=UPI000BB055E7|nr:MULTISPECIES: Imm26 family immunity protein [unclassified Mesorhizobium]PBC23680.1 hypothetical protein CK226_03840 [Mesorhizobium sp. WSM4311]TRD01135.1 hypothetical protein FJV82_21175 [Mesorhizobium sp. WSM4305]
MKKLPYEEGTVFAIPLRSSGYGVGLVARMAPKGKIILIYLFGPKRLHLPNEDELYKLMPEDAIRCIRCGDLGLINGSWPTIGKMNKWIADEWPIPEFMHRDILSGQILIRKYSDSDPSKLERQDRVASVAVDLEPDGLHGYGAVELLMTKQLDPI